MVSEHITDYRTFQKIDDKLRPVKVGTFVGGVILLLYSLRSIQSGGAGVLRGLIFGAGAVDMFRISFNCYIKAYCSHAARKIGGNTLKLGETILSWVQSAIGLNSSKVNDVFSRIQKEVMWDVVFIDTFASKLHAKVKT